MGRKYSTGTSANVGLKLFVVGGDMYNDFTELPVWHC